MTLYVGIKGVKAHPMTRGAYNELRGWQLPKDENGEDDGYLVEYLDGGQANVEGFAGYVSWSPKEVFERAYNPLPEGHKVTKEAILARVTKRMFTVIPETTITLCVLTLDNGFTVTGESACADPANFDEAVGQQWAEEAAIDKLWPLEGYLLREKLNAAGV